MSIDIWEFVKGLTARIICLEDAVNVKNLEINDLKEKMSIIISVVNELRKDHVIQRTSPYSKILKQCISTPQQQANNTSRLNTSVNRSSSKLLTASKVSVKAPVQKTPQKPSLSTSQSSNRSSRNTLKNEVQKPNTKLQKITQLQTTKSKTPLIQKEPVPRNIYINIAAATRQLSEANIIDHVTFQQQSEPDEIYQHMQMPQTERIELMDNVNTPHRKENTEVDQTNTVVNDPDDDEIL